MFFQSDDEKSKSVGKSQVITCSGNGVVVIYVIATVVVSGDLFQDA